MRKLFIILALAAGVMSACKSELQPVDYVDPFIGTGFHGHTFPGAAMPFGAVQLSPDNYANVWDACSGYHYDRDSLAGFSHTHLSGTGCADLADVLFRPGSGSEDIPYSHADEYATPGYYSVYLPSEGAKVELSATVHTGWHRYSFDSGKKRVIAIDLEHTITREHIVAVDMNATGADEISGMRNTRGWTPNQPVYFVAKFSEPVQNVEISEDKLHALLTFADGDAPVVAKVGLSVVGYDNARLNLSVEGDEAGFDFDSVRDNARAEWNALLSKMTVKGGTEAQKRTFYSALYHTAVAPNTISDVNGEFRRLNDEVAKKEHPVYSTLSLWDTFRAWLPLSSIIYPELLHDVVMSCIEMYDASGELPIWPLSSGETRCMVGYHSIPFIVDAYEKGLVPDLDVNHALEAMVASSHLSSGAADYERLGYIPYDEMSESVSKMLEYGYDDWCIAYFAELIGNKEVAAEYYKRAANYHNVFDASTGFFRGRSADGAFIEPFDPYDISREYTEATAFQYSFCVPHDFAGMTGLVGGDEKLAGLLDGLFNASSEMNGFRSDITGLIGQYAHGNEPSHHVAYVYNYVGQPWKTQAMTRRVLAELYDDTPAGISGNEDCGQMSAWYVLTSLGLYEVTPGCGQFTFTAPIFDGAKITMPSGDTLEIVAKGAAAKGYIRDIRLNGKSLDRIWVSFDEIKDGGKLEFVLSSTPVTNVFTSEEARPFSMTSLEDKHKAEWAAGSKKIDAEKVAAYGDRIREQKKLICFDLDATLTRHRTPLEDFNKAVLDTLSKRYDLAMVCAGNCPRVFEQMNHYPIDIIGNYGMQVSTVDENGELKIVKEVVIPADSTFFYEQNKYLREKYGYTKYSGEPLEFHATGMVTMGLLGTTPDIEAKLVFDPDRAKRRVMYPEVCEIFKDYSVYIGGSTSFDFSGKQYNKYDATMAYATEHGYTLDQVLFIGDDFADGGGDSHVRLYGMDYIEITDYTKVPEVLSFLF